MKFQAPSRGRRSHDTPGRPSLWLGEARPPYPPGRPCLCHPLELIPRLFRQLELFLRHHFPDFELEQLLFRLPGLVTDPFQRRLMVESSVHKALRHEHSLTTT